MLLYIILYYYILYYTLLFFCPSSFQSSPLLFSSSDLSSSVLSSQYSLPQIHSIRVGTYITLFIFNHSLLLFLPIPIFLQSQSSPLIQSFPSLLIILYVSALTYVYLCSINISNNLTPHVLSEWMVEV